MDETDHPRGQPENAGEFAKKESGGAAKSEAVFNLPHKTLVSKRTGETFQVRKINEGDKLVVRPKGGGSDFVIQKEELDNFVRSGSPEADLIRKRPKSEKGDE